MNNFNNENNVFDKDESEFHLIFDNDMENDEKYEYSKKMEEIVRKRNEILLSLGFSFDSDGNIISQNMQMHDGIIGFVVGDALGVPVEFSSREYMESNPVREMKGYCHYNVPAGTWSDDTSMMLATMDSIIEMGTIDYFDIMYKFCEWFDNSKYTATNEVFDIGVTIRKAIRRFKKRCNPIDCGSMEIYENGNGSLMRILPIIYFLNVNSKNISVEEEINIINNISSLTHAHEISCLGCNIYFDFVNQLLNGFNKYEALNYIKMKKYSEYYSIDSLQEYERVLKSDISLILKDDIKSTGYIVHTLESCLWSILNSDNFETSILTAVNLGGDTDTIGALTGAIAGIIYGKDAIPENWLNELKNRDYLENLIDEFVGSLKGITSHRRK